MLPHCFGDCKLLQRVYFLYVRAHGLSAAVSSAGVGQLHRLVPQPSTAVSLQMAARKHKKAMPQDHQEMICMKIV